MFTITPDPDRHRMVLTMDGGFRHDPRLPLREIKRTVPLVRTQSGWFDVLTDYSRVGLIPRNHSRGDERSLQWCRENGLRKCANVLVNAAQRMAVERMTANDPRFDFFLTREEAEHWLMRDWPGRVGKVPCDDRNGAQG